MAAASDPLVGDVVDGRYEIISRAGRGGMATVYRALDRRLDRIVAVKIMRDDLDDDPEYAKRFDSEARAVANLSSAHIVSVFDQGVDRGRPYIVMEFIEGTNLKAVLVQQGALPPERAVRLLEDVVSGVAVAHAAGIVHRDIKPENVLISRGNDVKVTDFGLARQSDAPTMTVADGVLGSLSYVSPERLLHQAPVDFRSDVYSIGVVAFEMLTGHKPFTGDTAEIVAQHLNADVPAPSTITAGIPPWLDALVTACGKRNADARPADAGELLARIRRGLAAMLYGNGHEPALVASMTEPSGSLAAVPPRLPPVAHEDTPTLASESGPADRVPAAQQVFKRRRIFAAVLAGVIVLGVVLGGWWLFSGRFTTMPDIVDQTSDAATSLVEAANLTLATEGAFSEDVAQGIVISSTPKAGSKVPRHSTVRAVVSLGPERYTVPQVTGISQADAEAAIGNNHLTLGTVTQDYSDTVPEGTVISSNPAEGTDVPPNTPIDLVVSQGPQPITVPDLTGQSQQGATDALTALGLVASITQANSCTVHVGNVISQDPSYSADNPVTLHKGDTVTLNISNGPASVTIPSTVIGMKSADALKTLQDLGLTVSFNYLGPDVTRQDVVMAVTPAPGTSVTGCGTKVILDIS
ncbi:MAG: Stk1 family PASTA domain-containing Ser/Thr kinase [Propionibacteriaceae bacterium]|nr:Stk1 family PASTA domain-containing Ser/Thr kinase [Propionibacteriaceae bacterium]